MRLKLRSTSSSDAVIRSSSSLGSFFFFTSLFQTMRNANGIQFTTMIFSVHKISVLIMLLRVTQSSGLLGRQPRFVPTIPHTVSSRFVNIIPTSSTNLEQDEDTPKDTDCPRGYFLDSIENSCKPLGPIGRISQAIETFGPLKKVYNSISDLFGFDPKVMSSLGIPFALSYAFLSQIIGSITLSIAWYFSCRRTGISPLAPGEWKSLLAAYASVYAAVQLLKPFRVAAAIGMSKLSKEFLEATEERLECKRSIAIFVQCTLGFVVWAILATTGITLASSSTGVPILAR